jgi:hypothetical protein
LLKECEDYARGRHALEPNAPDQLLNILLHELWLVHDGCNHEGLHTVTSEKAFWELLADMKS